MFAITFILSELNALQSSINRIISDNSMNQLNAAQIQTCTNSKIVLGKVKMFCVRGNQTNVFVSHTASFSNTNDFNASILFDATRLDRFVYAGQISYSSQMQMFSLVSSGSLRITSSNISVSQLQCPSAALLSSRGALVLNNSAVSFSHSGQASGGLVFESLDMAVFNVAFACSITASYGGLFAFSASGKLVLDRFSATGAFTVPSPSLVNAGSLLAITIRNASAAFFVQSRCASGSCSMAGLLVAGLDPAFSCGSNAEYCGMRQVLFGDYLQKEIVVDGVAVQARCAVEGVQDFNYSYVRVDESVSGAKANSSLFCFRPVFTRMIVSGSYQVTGSGSDVSCGSIFVASPDLLVTLQNSKVEVNFVTSGQADISVFLNQDKNTISVTSSNFSITLQPNSQASFFGVSKSSKSVLVIGCRFIFSSTNLNEFCGISRSIASLQINTLLLQMNVNSFVAYGFGQIASGTVSATLVNLTGQLSGTNTYGILCQAQSIASLSSFQYSLKNLGTTQTCGFIQVISQANTVTTTNIVFSGFSGTLNIPSSFGSSSTCPCMANSNLVSGMCYCITGASPQGNVCTCTQYSQLVGASCVCQVPETTLTNGICICRTQNALITYNSGQYICQCGINATNTSNVCVCPQKSTLRGNTCVCDTLNAFPDPPVYPVFIENFKFISKLWFHSGDIPSECGNHQQHHLLWFFWKSEYPEFFRIFVFLPVYDQLKFSQRYVLLHQGGFTSGKRLYVHLIFVIGWCFLCLPGSRNSFDKWDMLMLTYWLDIIKWSLCLSISQFIFVQSQMRSPNIFWIVIQLLWLSVSFKLWWLRNWQIMEWRMYTIFLQII
ncbi:Hypothetical_protein [Hexamita inflata]|uniref:Hypothetical_protein n=1 Tax=Hexamita inflata TaxID=28002 RepID=A0AA86THJ2_9EUKA|nr:Hypothetical protein HINF_LOCUS3932 [Hexamita inflata]